MRLRIQRHVGVLRLSPLIRLAPGEVDPEAAALAEGSLVRDLDEDESRALREEFRHYEPVQAVPLEASFISIRCEAGRMLLAQPAGEGEAWVVHAEGAVYRRDQVDAILDAALGLKGRPDLIFLDWPPPASTPEEVLAADGPVRRFLQIAGGDFAAQAAAKFVQLALQNTPPPPPPIDLGEFNFDGPDDGGKDNT